MSTSRNVLAALAASVLLAVSPAAAQSLSPDMKAKVDARLRELQAWSADAAFVSAVKAFNGAPPAEAAGMTEEKWKALSLLDPVVRSFTRNPLGVTLKARKAPQIAEIFVSGANGGKVAFLSKPTSWCHKGKPKHDMPMAGKVWYGPVETDESTGQLQVQVAVPVLDGSKPIGSIVVGLSVAKL
jgi:hypothetical protein